MLKWVANTAELKIKVPVVKTTPSECAISYTITIPKALKTVAKVVKGDIVFKG